VNLGFTKVECKKEKAVRSLTKAASLTLRLEQAEDIVLADRALDVANDGARGVIHEFDTDLSDTTTGASAAEYFGDLCELDGSLSGVLWGRKGIASVILLTFRDAMSTKSSMVWKFLSFCSSVLQIPVISGHACAMLRMSFAIVVRMSSLYPMTEYSIWMHPSIELLIHTIMNPINLTIVYALKERDSTASQPEYGYVVRTPTSWSDPECGVSSNLLAEKIGFGLYPMLHQALVALCAIWHYKAVYIISHLDVMIENSTLVRATVSCPGSAGFVRKELPDGERLCVNKAYIHYTVQD
jgi:hypothetical protein